MEGLSSTRPHLSGTLPSVGVSMLVGGKAARTDSFSLLPLRVSQGRPGPTCDATDR